MILDRVGPGRNLPEEFNVIIEIPAHADPVKYEIDKESGALFVDRFMNTSMHYPCNYGYIPHTLCEDGDPLDVLVVAPLPVISGCVVRCRPLGVLKRISTSASGRGSTVGKTPKRPRPKSCGAWNATASNDERAAPAVRDAGRRLTPQIGRFHTHNDWS